MAKHLARIHGTEEDKVNCPFYFKIGACRHMDRCSRLHHKPAFSPTLLVKHVYRHPVRQAELEQAANAGGNNPGEGATVDKEKAREDFLCFFEDMFTEFSKFGRIDCLHVVDNIGDHLIGHVYIKFTDEEDASDALQVMNGRYYDGRRMEVEFSPVTDFREARCRDFDEESCSRGGFCNFLHVKPVPICLIASMEDDCEADRRLEADKRREKERDEKERKHRSRDRDHKKRKREKRSREDRSDSSGGEDDHDDAGDKDEDGGRRRSRDRDRDRRHHKKHRKRSRRSSSHSDDDNDDDS